MLVLRELWPGAGASWQQYHLGCWNLEVKPCQHSEKKARVQTLEVGDQVGIPEVVGRHGVSSVSIVSRSHLMSVSRFQPPRLAHGPPMALDWKKKARARGELMAHPVSARKMNWLVHGQPAGGDAIRSSSLSFQECFSVITSSPPVASRFILTLGERDAKITPANQTGRQETKMGF